MKSSLRRLRGFAIHKHDHKDKKLNPSQNQDELLQAAQDMVEMRNCYDSLLSAAAATANSAYEFSESLREMGTCLLEKTAISDDEEIGRVLLMLGKTQFELQKLVDNYRANIIKTITTPSESLLKELQTVEEMKLQCDDKRDLFKFLLAAQKEKGRSRNVKGESFTPQQLQAAQDDYQEESALFVFRLKSLKQGQSRSLLTQAARHHAAQLNFFTKGLKSLEVVEPHVKSVSEKQHIDYKFSGLEDEDSEYDNDDNESLDNNDDDDNGELSFSYGQRDLNEEVSSMTKSTMEKHTERSQASFNFLNKGPRTFSLSAPLLNNKTSELSDRIKQLRPSSTRKFNTYVLPTPADVLTSSGNSPPSQVENKGGWPTQLWHSSPLQPNMSAKDFRDVELPSPIEEAKMKSVLKESNTNSNFIRKPRAYEEGLSMQQVTLPNASDSKKDKIHAFSGPLLSKESADKTFLVTGSWSSVEHPTIVGLNPKLVLSSQTESKKRSPSASPPPMSSPRINELHELPRPPIGLAKSTRPSNLIGHSAPLVSRGQELNAANKPLLNSLYTATPLPPPPVSMARSFSIPSSVQRAQEVTVTRLLDGAHSQRTIVHIHSPPRTSALSTTIQIASATIDERSKGTYNQDLN